MMSYEEVLKT